MSTILVVVICNGTVRFSAVACLSQKGEAAIHRNSMGEKCSARYQGSSRRGSGEEAGRRASVQGYFAGISAEHTLRVATTVGNSPKHRPQGLKAGKGGASARVCLQTFPQRKEGRRESERERAFQATSARAVSCVCLRCRSAPPPPAVEVEDESGCAHD